MAICSWLVRRKKVVLVGILCAIYIGLVCFSLFNYCGRCRISMPSPYRLDVGSRDTTTDFSKDVCIVNLDKLGIVDVNIASAPSFSTTKLNNPDVKKGGAWKPTGCHSLQKVAIIIPYRDRESHLKTLLARLHPMLQRQMIDYRIFVVEQYGTDLYNKGKIMNICFEYALKLDDFDCFVFHDVDLIPENEQNIYMCDEQFRHLSPAVDEMRYHVMYYNLGGGAIALTPHKFRLINGFSNVYWGWGNEDDDISARAREAGLLLTRPPDHIGRYKMVRHVKANRAAHAYGVFWGWRSRWITDGLNNAETMKHKIVSRTDAELYTNITVDVGPSEGHMLEPKDLTERESVWWFLQFYFP